MTLKRTMLVLTLSALTGGVAWHVIPYRLERTRLARRAAAFADSARRMVEVAKSSQSPDQWCAAVLAMPRLAKSGEELASAMTGHGSRITAVRGAVPMPAMPVAEVGAVRAALDSTLAGIDALLVAGLVRQAVAPAPRYAAAKQVREIEAIAQESDQQLGTAMKCAVASARDTTRFRQALGIALSEPLGNTSTKGVRKLRDLSAEQIQQNANQRAGLSDASAITQAVERDAAMVRQARTALRNLCAAGAAPNECASANLTLQSAASLATSDLRLVNRVIEAQERASMLVKRGLAEADEANRSLSSLERFARSEDIGAVVSQWSAAKSTAEAALAALYVPTANDRHQTMGSALLSRSRSNVQQILAQVTSHTSLASQMHAEAQQQEANWAGSATRAARRTFGRLLNRASESRIGGELTIAVKTLILGTKAFYDLMDPNADPLTWAMKYESDVTRLMEETDRVMQMPGPSLTGKGTAVENLVNSAYARTSAPGLR